MIEKSREQNRRIYHRNWRGVLIFVREQILDADETIMTPDVEQLADCLDQNS